jgi:hypothetical protein
LNDERVRGIGNPEMQPALDVGAQQNIYVA